MASNESQFVKIRGSSPIQGEITIPGDKSISHRILLLALLAQGRTVVDNFSPAADCRETLAAMLQMGLDCRFEGITMKISEPDQAWREKSHVIYAGNSGTTARLTMGLAGFLGTNGSITITGDPSLSRRPMERVARYLRPMGINIKYLADSDRLPLCLTKPGELMAVSHTIEIPSAQVKSAILIAGLAANGVTEVTQNPRSRDHTEIMLQALGAEICGDGYSIRVTGGSQLRLPTAFTVPGDFSSAAWWAGMAAVSGSISLKDVGINPTRIGFLDALRAMGAIVASSNERLCNGEMVADLHIQEGSLQGVEIGPEMVPLCIDELPALAVVGAFARGKTVVRGAKELRYKESDRLNSIAHVLKAFGANFELYPDGFEVRGNTKLHHANIQSEDHRIIMAGAMLAALVSGVSEIGDTRWLGVSYPSFLEDMGKVTQSFAKQH